MSEACINYLSENEVAALVIWMLCALWLAFCLGTYLEWRAYRKERRIVDDLRAEAKALGYNSLTDLLEHLQRKRRITRGE